MASCTSEEGTTTTVQNDLTHPIVTWPLDKKQTMQVDGINDFAMELLRRADEVSAGNDIVISPISLVYALAMTADGASGQTRNEITTALGFTAGDAHSLASLCASLIHHYYDDDVLNTANAMFVRQDLHVNDDFRMRLVDYYDAIVEQADFSVPEAMESINRWVSKQTHGMIPRLEGGIDASTTLCLINAVSMRAKWEMPFVTSMTRNSSFHKADGTSCRIPTMQNTEMMTYTEMAQAQILELPYKGGRYAMTIFLPRSAVKPMDAFKGITGSGLLRERQTLCATLVNACVPRFATSFQHDLRTAVSDMGIVSAFDPAKAQFPHISDDDQFLSTLLHEAVINVNEEGTDAAAVTVVGGEASTGDSVKPVFFTADHPFLYLITDKDTGVIIFTGIYYGNNAA